MASNDYDDLLKSFMSNSTKAYNEDKTNRENADTVPASYSVSSNSDKKAKKIQRGRDIEKELVQKQEKRKVAPRTISTKTNLLIVSKATLTSSLKTKGLL